MCNCGQPGPEALRGTPDEISQYAPYLYTPEELSLLAILADGSLSQAELEERLGQNSDQILDFAYRRASVDRVMEDGEIVGYSPNPIARRVNNMATFHRSDWEALPAHIRQTLSHWHFRQFVEMKRSMGYPGVAAKGNQVLPLEQVIAYMRATTEDVWVIPCDCKSTAGNCDEERWGVCLEFASGPNTAVGRGYGEKLTLDQAETLLRRADALGLYHTAEKHGICNCCRCCCYPGRTTLELGHKGLWPKVLYIAQRDEGRCTGCMRCVERCPKGALVAGADGIQFIPENCWGCGLCRSTCPAEAISMSPLD